MKGCSYSTYEAKARFSEILRKVRRGESVFISYRGKEVAEIRPVQEEVTPEERLDRLEQQGIVSAEPTTQARISPLVCSPGALKRFLESRD